MLKEEKGILKYNIEHEILNFSLARASKEEDSLPD